MISEHAIKAGYWIFPAVDLADGHMECVAPIGKDLYTVELQTNAVSLWAVKPQCQILRMIPAIPLSPKGSSLLEERL